MCAHVAQGCSHLVLQRWRVPELEDGRKRLLDELWEAARTELCRQREEGEEGLATVERRRGTEAQKGRCGDDERLAEDRRQRGFIPLVSPWVSMVSACATC